MSQFNDYQQLDPKSIEHYIYQLPLSQQLQFSSEVGGAINIIADLSKEQFVNPNTYCLETCNIFAVLDENLSKSIFSIEKDFIFNKESHSLDFIGFAFFKNRIDTNKHYNHRKFFVRAKIFIIKEHYPQFNTSSNNLYKK